MRSFRLYTSQPAIDDTTLEAIAQPMPPAPAQPEAGSAAATRRDPAYLLQLQRALEPTLGTPGR